MTQDIKEQIRDRYIGEYIADAGAKKPGILGKIWRGVKGFQSDLALLKERNREGYGMIVGLGPVGVVVMTLSALGGAAIVGAAIVAAEIAFAAGFIAADIQVRREARDDIARDIADGKLDARFRQDTETKSAPELQQAQGSLPERGAAAAHFGVCAECAPVTEPLLPPTRGIERPHGSNFG